VIDREVPVPMSSDTGPIVLVGPGRDDHIQAIRHLLEGMGEEPFLLDPLQFPASQRISMGTNSAAITVDGVDLGKPGAVYIRSMQQSPIAYGSQAELGDDWRRTLTLLQERNTLLNALVFRWEAMGVPMYNPFSSQRAITKPFQLALLQGAGLPVPKTLWTNDPDDVEDLAAETSLIYKPVTGGAQTRVATSEDLSPERLAHLAAAPVTFQELLPGDDIRVFLIDGEVVAQYRIVTPSEAIDYRQNELAIENIQLPEETLSRCRRACDVIGLRFTGMDLKYDARGDAKILELNNSPMFLGFDARAGTDIAGRLASALLAASD